MSKKLLFLNLFGASLLAAGALLFIGITRNHAVNIISTPPQPAVAQQTVAAAAPAPQGYITGVPTSLSIPSLNINIPVIPGYYDAASQTWTLTTNKVQFATLSTQPNNQSGNTFIYGHARSNLFGSLPKIQAGAVAMVNTNNGHTFYYTLSSTQVVDPADSDAVFGYNGKPILTLQTCVGLLYQNRELLTFNLQRVV